MHVNVLQFLIAHLQSEVYFEEIKKKKIGGEEQRTR